MREKKASEFERNIPPRLVFNDASGWRRRLFNALLMFLLVFLSIVLGEFIYRINQFNRPSSLGETIVPEIGSRDFSDFAPTTLELDSGQAPRCEENAWLKTRPKTGLAGYVPAGNRAAVAALALHCGALDAVYYAGLTLRADGTVEGIKPFAFPIEGFQDPHRFADRPEFWPVVTPQAGLDLRDLSMGIMESDILTVAHVREAVAAGAAGICLDLSGSEGIAPDTAHALVRRLASNLSGSSLKTCLIGMADAGFLTDIKIVAETSRLVALMRRSGISPSAPPSPRDWMTTEVARLSQAIPFEKLRYGLITTGAAWKSGRAEVENITYPAAMLSAAENQASPTFDPADNALKLYFLDSSGRPTHLWLPDAATLTNTLGALGTATEAILWPLGGEDPSFWQTGRRLPFENRLAYLPQEIDLSSFVALYGDGPFPVLSREAVTGFRSIEIASDGTLAGLSYPILPQPTQINLIGGTDLPTVAVTFDGVGKAAALERVLEILTARRIEATFFIDIADVLFRKSDVARIIDGGHSVAILARVREHLSHSKSIFLRTRTKLSQHGLAHELGIVALMVREPGVASEQIQSLSELAQLRESQKAGLLPIRLGLSAPLTEQGMQSYLDRLRNLIVNETPQILRFDMSQENSEATAKLLDATLREIERDGIVVHSLPEMAGVDRNLLQPADLSIPNPADDTIYSFLRVSWLGIEQFVFLLALIVALRAPVFLGLALFWRDRFKAVSDFHPPVTVVVPAYNEATVIERTVRSILTSHYPEMKVIVVDDGSTDDTIGVLKSAFSGDKRVHLITQTNHGKWFAENTAINALETEFFVVVDADTLLDPDALGHLMAPFVDEAVGAVAGTVEVGNPDNFIALCQKLEYLVSQSVMRRAYEVFDGILVVPGAIGAWRLEAVKKAGFVSGETITEDADLTVAVHRANFKVVYQPEARSYTEVPETTSSFLKQRLRWSLGMLQVSRKHARSIIEWRTVGLISLLDALWFRVSSSLVFPIVDALLFFTIIDGLLHFWIGESAAIAELSPLFFLSFVLLALADMSLVLAAFWFDGKGDWRLVPIVPLLRFGYRQLLYISSFRSILHAITGQLRGWQKLERTGAARLPDQGA